MVRLGEIVHKMNVFVFSLNARLTTIMVRLGEIVHKMNVFVFSL